MKGVILAAGQGSRMSSVTYDAYPKELIPIGNVPTIRFALETLKVAGVTKVFVVINADKDGIVAGLGSGKQFGVDIGYVVQERRKEFTGVGAAIYSVKGWFDECEDVVVVCGDTILCDFSKPNPFCCIEPLLKVHKYMDSIATVIVYPTNSDPTRYGVVEFDRILSHNEILFGKLSNLVEKPNLEVARQFRSNGYNHILTGYYVFKSKIFSYIERTKPGVNGEIQITDSIQLALKEGERICAVIHANGSRGDFRPCHYWDMGIPEDYKEANKHLFDLDLNRLLSEI